MIKKVTIRRLKGVNELTVPLGETVVLVGPNNSLKTTALQALSLWNFALERWLEKRGKASRAKQRVGVPVSRLELVTPPIPDAKMLWKDLKVYSGPNQPAMIEIFVEGRDQQDRPWKFGMEIQSSTSEQVIVRPMRSLEDSEERMEVPDDIRDIRIVYLPALSGIQQVEEQLSTGSQNKRIGEGRAGDVLRNLLYDVYNNNRDNWGELKDHFLDMFQVELCPPVFVERTSQIIAEFYTGLPERKEYNRHPRIEISCGGSGFLQALLLFAFLYARPGNTVLLDEPDAHFETIRQRDIYTRLRSLTAKRNAQLIIATHSEVIFDETDFEDIITFPSGCPLGTKHEKSQFRKLLTLIPSIDYFWARERHRYLYMEDFTDREILTTWAHILHHPAEEILKSSPWKSIGNNINEARSHFHGLRKMCPDLKGFVIIDRNDDIDVRSEGGLNEYMWRRREIENYMLVPNAIERICNQLTKTQNDEAATSIDMLQEHIEPMSILLKYLVQPAIDDPYGDHPQLLGAKASDEILVPFFQAFFKELCMYNTMPKKGFYQIAEVMKPDEIHHDVKEVLDMVRDHFIGQTNR